MTADSFPVGQWGRLGTDFSRCDYSDHDDFLSYCSRPQDHDNGSGNHHQKIFQDKRNPSGRDQPCGLRDDAKKGLSAPDDDQGIYDSIERLWGFFRSYPQYYRSGRPGESGGGSQRPVGKTRKKPGGHDFPLVRCGGHFRPYHFEAVILLTMLHQKDDREDEKTYP